jgi:outer membrane protein assembly factor BamB
LVYADYFYNLSDWIGKLTCFDAKTGKSIYEEKLSDAKAITASGIASNGKIYYSNEEGTVFVLKTCNKFELISKNSLNDFVMATPAISENMLFFRTQRYIIAIGK